MDVVFGRDNLQAPYAHELAMQELPLAAEDIDPELLEIGTKIMDAFVEVHRQLGPGLYEEAVRDCLVHELTLRGLKVRKEVRLGLVYKGLRLKRAYKIDIVVEGKVLVELKAVDQLSKRHFAQVRTYLKLSGLQLGYLVNFDEVPVHKGVRRLTPYAEVLRS